MDTEMLISVFKKPACQIFFLLYLLFIVKLGYSDFAIGQQLSVKDNTVVLLSRLDLTKPALKR